MTDARTFAQSFDGGEVSPQFYGRTEDNKYKTGLATCRNFIVLPHGPVSKRPGFAYVNTAKTPAKRARVIPFTYSTTQTMVMEFGETYIRFHTMGATLLSGGIPYEVATPYLEADLFDIHFVQSADVLTLVHPNYPPMILKRLGATNWTLTAVVFGTLLVPPTALVSTANVPTGATGLVIHEYAVTSVSADGLDESLLSVPAIGTSATISAISQANPGVITVTSFTGTLGVGQSVTINGVVGMTPLNGNTYTVGSVNTTTSYGGFFSGSISTFTLLNLDGTPLDTTSLPAYVGGGTLGLSGVMNNIYATGAYNTVTWTAAAGVTRYNVYKKSNGLWGFLGQTTVPSFKDDDIVPNVGQTPPLGSNPFSGAGNYPGAVSYYEQRKAFAGTINAPQNLWMTQSGTEFNLNYSIPVKDSDSISFRVAAREANTIRHIVPLTSLLLLTSSAEWRVTSTNGGALTPASVSVQPQAYIGASNVQPVIVNYNLVYPAARGGHMRELAYSWQANGYVTGDLSLRAHHLFDGLEIVDMAFAKAVYPIIWAVSSNGNLLGLTYIPEQQIGAWHHHDTAGGLFESVTVVSEGSEDFLYAVVNRTINGVQTRFIERLSSQILPTDPAAAFFVDAGSTYSGAPAIVISGLGYLNGATVNILADGAVQPQQVVTGGTITLTQAASQVQVGLPITSDIESLPLVLPFYLDFALGEGKPKNVNRVWLRVFRAGAISAGPSFSMLTEYKQRTTEVYGAPTALATDQVEIVVQPSWDNDAPVCVRHGDPVPALIESLTIEAAIGG